MAKTGRRELFPIECTAGNIEIGDFDLPTTVRTIERQQAGLQGDKGQGPVGANGAAHDAAGIGVKAAGQDDRQYWAGERGDGRDQLRRPTLQRALQADAEQGVDDQGILSRRNFAEQLAAAGEPGVVRRARIGGQARGIAGEDDVDLMARESGPWALRVQRVSMNPARPAP